LLKDRVCPLVIKSFKLSTAFPYVIRLQRILAIFIKNFSNLLQTECEVFLSRPVRLLEMPENPLWLHTLALEVLKELLSDPSLMSALYLSYDVSKSSGNNGSSTGSSGNREDGGAAGAQNNIFQSISMALATFLHYLFRQDPEVVIRVISMKARCMDMLALPEAPNIPTTYAILTALECLAGIVECMGQLANSASTPQEKTACSQLVSNAWPSINNTLSLILSKTNDEALIQSILNSYQSFANTCAALNLDKPRDTIITFLTKYVNQRRAQSLTLYSFNSFLPFVLANSTFSFLGKPSL
jgi:hypothetical protein